MYVYALHSPHKSTARTNDFSWLMKQIPLKTHHQDQSEVVKHAQRLQFSKALGREGCWIQLRELLTFVFPIQGQTLLF